MLIIKFRDGFDCEIEVSEHHKRFNVSFYLHLVVTIDEIHYPAFVRASAWLMGFGSII